ncbi:hypothetical protein [Streptomyces formicae]|uniref:DUF11 domain-containing protein n=1 Tax=Streptomyces formicae TaxID=1616117 RepID=A0ABY3WYB0_9ACTN|nr:hypothetical protein [Streptomyces formicae]UNM15777.1 hypothetical protein J4032_33785 [Streptomyces formicae]
MRKPSVGRPARMAACAVAAGLATVATATPALADGDQLWIRSPYEVVLPKAAGSGEQARSVTLDLGLSHDNADHRVTDGRLTVDVSGLAGIADVTWPENCAPAGTTALCTVPEVPAAGPGGSVPVQVRAAAEAEVGASGRITYQATATTTMAGGVLTAPDGFETTVRIGSGPDLVLDRPAPVEGVAPGSTVPVPFSVVNNGNEPANGVRVTLYVTRGLDVGGVAPECTATPLGEGAIKPVTMVDCAFDDVVEPGAGFTLPAPLTATVAPYALDERIDMGVAAGDGAADLAPEDNGGVAAVKAENTADFAIRGAKVTGAAGETVRAELTFRNKGPAWVANLGSGDPVAAIDLIVPEGATVTAVPENCTPRTLDGDWVEEPTGAPRYRCELPLWVAEKQAVTFPFQLRIDTVVPRASGKITLTHPYSTTQPLAFDPNVRNNTAKLVLNPAR